MAFYKDAASLCMYMSPPRLKSLIRARHDAAHVVTGMSLPEDLKTGRVHTRKQLFYVHTESNDDGKQTVFKCYIHRPAQSSI